MAAEAQALGRGGVAAVSLATCVSRRAIYAGLKELADPSAIETNRIRKEGGGRKRAVDKDSTLRSDLDSLVEPFTRGDLNPRFGGHVRVCAVWLKNSGAWDTQ